MTTKDYIKYFSPQVYMDLFKDPIIDEFYLKRLTSFWTKVVQTRTSSLLEYGCGPTISRFITASKYVQNIIAAEHLQSNRKEIEYWIAQDTKAFNWRPTFEYVVQDLEGGSHEEVEKREAEVREKIKAIVPCDIKSSNPLQIPSNAKYGPPFDVVSTCLCLEAVVESEKEYKDHVAYLASLVRSGGYLLMHGVLEQTFYTVGEKFYTFPLTKEMVFDSMKAGLKNIVIDFHGECNFLPEADMKDIFVVYGLV